MISMKFLRLLASVAFCLFPFTIVAQVTPKIAMVTHGQLGDPFWLVVRSAAETAARQTKCDLDYRSPDHFDLAAMSHLIDEAVSSKPDGLIVSIPDVAILGPSIQAAVAAGIPVISINSGLAVSKQLGCLMHIGQEDQLAGKKAGERMKESGVKNVLILNQEVGNSGLDQRIRGFKDGFEGPFHHTQVLPVAIDFEKCRQAVNDFLSKNSEVDGIVALGPVAADPALQAIKELNKVGDVKLCTFDTSPLILNALANKQLEFAVDQQQWLQGYLPVVFLANYLKYGSMVQNDLILTGPSFVTPANARKALNILSGESGWNP